MITSTQNERVRLTQALQTQAKRRRREGLIALEGLRLVRDALAAGGRPAFIFCTPDQAEAVEGALLVAPDVMRYMSDTQSPQGVIGVFPLPDASLPAPLQRALVLDALRDPGNLGTMLRTAAAAGVEAALLAPGCVDPYNPKTLRAGMGAHFRLTVRECNWEEIAGACADLTCYLAAGDADHDYDRADWRAPWALIIGGEAHGAGPEAERLARSRVRIPLAAETESLNAAAAAAVILLEAARQRRA